MRAEITKILGEDFFSNEFVSKLITQAKKYNAKRGVRLLLPEQDERVKQAVEIIKQLKIALPITIAKNLAKKKIMLKPEKICSITEQLIKQNTIDAAILGASFATRYTLKLAFKFMHNAKRVSGAMLMLPKRKNKPVFFIADIAAMPNPNADQLAEIALLTARTFNVVKFLFKRNANIAMLSYSTFGSGKGDDAMKMREAVKKARRLLKAKLNAVIDGEMQLDAALIKQVAIKKAKEMHVKPLIKGNANVLIMPNLSSANICYKAIQHIADYYAVGPILQGVKPPINDLSRGCSIADIVLLAAFTTLQVHKSISESI